MLGEFWEPRTSILIGFPEFRMSILIGFPEEESDAHTDQNEEHGDSDEVDESSGFSTRDATGERTGPESE